METAIWTLSAILRGEVLQLPNVELLGLTAPDIVGIILSMNPLAEELNKVLENSVIDRLLSDFGKRFYFPKGIVAQSTEAKKQAHRFNATIGMAFSDGKPMELPSIARSVPDLGPAEAVAYAPTPGDGELLDLWKREILRKNPEVREDGISQPTLVPGLTNGIAQIADLFVNPKDAVVVPDMFWGNYKLIFVERKEAEIIGFPFFNEQGGLNVEGFKETMRANIRNNRVMVMVNFPNNPTGYSPSEEEADALTKAIGEIAEEGVDVLVVTDDAYFGLFYEENTYKHSLFAKLYNLHPRVLAVKVDGATKEDFVWGFRVGFVTFGAKGITQEQYEALRKKLAGSIRSTVSNSSRPAQSILLRALKSEGYLEEKAEFAKILKERYLKVREVVQNRNKGLTLKPLPFNSGYFMSFFFEGGSAEKLRLELLHNHGVGTISIQDKYLRVAYSSVDKENIEELYNTIFETADTIAAS